MFWRRKRAREAVTQALHDQAEHEAQTKHPFDSGQRKTAVLIRAGYILRQKNLKFSKLKQLVDEVLRG